MTLLDEARGREFLAAMMFSTLLNCCYGFKGFVYEVAHLADEARKVIEVEGRSRPGSKPYCSGCGKHGVCGDHLPACRFEFILIGGFAVLLLYAKCRVNCKGCSVVVELLPWAHGKHALTDAYMQFLAIWARKLSWRRRHIVSTSFVRIGRPPIIVCSKLYPMNRQTPPALARAFSRYGTLGIGRTDAEIMREQYECKISTANNDYSAFLAAGKTGELLGRSIREITRQIPIRFASLPIDTADQAGLHVDLPHLSGESSANGKVGRSVTIAWSARSNGF